MALFAGGGGGLLASRRLGWRTVCAVEVDPFARSLLIKAQKHGHLERFPIWDDVKTFDGNEWRGCVDVVSGGFPCTDISPAGGKAGISGPKSGLWAEMARVVGEIRPRFVFIENSADLVFRGLERVLCDLASMGFDAEWGVMGACAVGAPHKRERVWVLAFDPDDANELSLSQYAEVARLSGLLSGPPDP